MQRADQIWQGFRRQRWWVQLLGWLFFWGVLAAIWLARRPGRGWLVVAAVPALLWFGTCATIVTPSTPTPTPSLASGQGAVNAPTLPPPRPTPPPTPTPRPTPTPAPTPTAVPTPTATPVGFTLASAHRSVAVERWGQVNNTTYGFLVKVCALPGSDKVTVLPTDFKLILSDQTRALPELFDFTSGLEPKLGAETLLPGDCVRGWLVYTLQAGVTPVELRYEPLDQLGNPLARWKLGG